MLRQLFLLGCVLQLSLSLIAQKLSHSLVYQTNNHDFARETYDHITLTTRMLFFFPYGYSAASYNGSAEYLAGFQGRQKTRVVKALTISLAAYDRWDTLADGTMIPEDTTVFRSIQLIKKKKTIYLLSEKDTTAFFSLKDTLHRISSLDLFEASSINWDFAVTTYQGKGHWKVDGKRRAYWLFTEEHDWLRHPCSITMFNGDRAPDLFTSIEVYIDRKTLLPLKRVVFLRSCYTGNRLVSTIDHQLIHIKKTDKHTPAPD